jgi:hypothetical protein
MAGALAAPLARRAFKVAFTLISSAFPEETL